MSFLKNSAVISFTTLISRILGYFRDLILASLLGAGPINDCFIAAFKFANLFRNVFGEGAFNSAFVPSFSHALSSKSINHALKLASRVQIILIISLLIFVALCITLMPIIMEFTTPGFVVNSAEFHIAVELARIMMPYLFFISLAAFYGGILNSMSKFMPFAATSIIFNISLILFALYCNDVSTKAHAVAYGVLAAGVIEVIWMLFFIKKNDAKVPLIWPSIDSEVKHVIKKIGPGVIGSGVYQINTWIDMIIVSFIPGGMSYIYYADRIMQLPLALIATATSTALLPALARRIAELDNSKAHDLKENSVRVTAFFIIPTSLVFFSFSHEIIALLLERGLFTSIATAKTAAALKVISIGLPAFALLKLLNNIFYAFGDTSTPVKISGLCLCINVIISVTLLSYYEHVAISIASTIAGWSAVILLIFLAKRKNYYSIHLGMVKSIAIYFITGLLSVFAITYCFAYLNFILCCFIGGGLYLIINYALYKINISLK